MGSKVHDKENSYSTIEVFKDPSELSPFKNTNDTNLKPEAQTRRFRRTLSFMNMKRKRTSKSCTLNRTANRRLSLNPAKKQHLMNKSRSKGEIGSNSLENSFNNSLPTDEESLNKSKEMQNRRFSINPRSFSAHRTPSSSRKSKFKSLKLRLKRRNNYEATLQLLQKQTLFDIDQRLKDYIQNQDLTNVSINSSSENEELNNKIDLEIRILDGILKLLNAICSSSLTPAMNSSNQVASNQSSTGENSVASMLINSLDINKLDEVSKCHSMGAEIATAIMTNRLPTDSSKQGASSTTGNYTPYTTTASGSSSSSTVSTVSSSVTLPAIINESTDSIFQILSACKCLYVSHRKIAIYLQNLQELEKKNLQIGSSENLTENSNLDISINDKSIKEGTIKKSPFKSSQKPKAPLANLTLNPKNNSSPVTKVNSNRMVKQPSYTTVEICTTKIMLKDLRVPLVWKWSDHLKAIKNPENVTAKFATFAIIHLGNMIYDTQLISNIDPSITDVSFSETFIFDDVKQNNFEINIEFYSYELFNTGNNILTSAKKLAKTLTDFATFKRTGNNSHQLAQQHHSISSFNTLPTQSSGNSSNSYSYSMHKFKLIARAKLSASDITEDVETKHLQLINESNLDQTQGNSTGGSSNGNISVQSHSNPSSTLSSVSSANSPTTKLPLFDYYSCCLCYAPTSTYI